MMSRRANCAGGGMASSPVARSRIRTPWSAAQTSTRRPPTSATAPWAVTTVVSCLPVLVLALGTALAHMLRADAAALDAAGSRSGPPTAQWSVSWSQEDQAGPGRGRREADRDRSASRDQAGPAPGPQHGRGITGLARGPRRY